jgi:hypothetical protein
MIASKTATPTPITIFFQAFMMARHYPGDLSLTEVKSCTSLHLHKTTLFLPRCG